jgi:arylsulfatase A-like enzyme/NAD(P)H-dependent FMN reductase
VKILALVGSLRGASFSRRLALAAAQLAPPDVAIALEDGRDLPLFDQDLEVDPRPEPVQRLVESVSDADALLFVTPEYNCGVPGSLKNLIDWASRPPLQSPLKGRPAMIMALSPAQTGGARVHAQLTAVLGGTLTPLHVAPGFLVPAVHEKFDAEGRLVDERTRQRLEKTLGAFVHWARPLCIGVLALTLLASSLAQPVQAGAPVDARPGRVLPMQTLTPSGPVGLTVDEVPRHDFPVPQPPEGAPNVMIVLLDDVGFAASSTFGGAIPTPALERLAEGGLRYNRFHTTAICSPTRASLLTGRNPHAAGVGAVLNSVQPYRGRAGIVTRETATIAEVLRHHGYATAAFGKWHLTPDHEASPTGPFDRWPTGMGFDHFYGFLGGETHQFAPTLFEGTRALTRAPDEGYHVTADLADRAIEWVHLHQTLRRDQPFLLYLAPGATHAPLHAPREWIDRFAGQFDHGWDEERRRSFLRQKKLGVIPEDAELTPRPDELRAWDSLSEEERRVAARLMEIYAGFLAHTDAQVGRVFDALREAGLFEDTLVLYVVGDNGASGEGGGDYGTWNEMGRIQGVVQTPAEILERIDALGGMTSYPHYPAGWAWATNTPFQWVKQVASHLGGTRTPLVVSWPGAIRDRGGLRSQFGHVNDVVPTILEVVGVAAPVEVNGVAQRPIDGTSLVYTFEEARADERHETQYFEVLGNRALYHRGMLLSTRNRARVPWAGLVSTSTQTGPEVWELYDLRSDFSQSRDLAAERPLQLEHMKALFWAEAGRHQGLPYSGRPSGESPIPSQGEGLDEATYFAGAWGLHESAVPDLKNRDHHVVADVVVPEAGASGVIATQGGVVAGWALYVTEEGRPAYVYNLFGKTVTTIVGESALDAGSHRLELRFDYDEAGRDEAMRWGRGARLELRVDGDPVAEGRLDRSVPGFFSIDETFDVGLDTGSPAGDYPPGFAWSGTLERVQLRAAPGSR